MKDPNFLTFMETCRTLGKSRASVYRLITSGILTPHYRPAYPRTPIFSRAEVEALDIPGPREPIINNPLHKKAKKRDGKCVVCNSNGLLFAHHVIPAERGGSDTLENLVTLCSLCHVAFMDGAIPYGIKEKAMRHGTQAVVNWLFRSADLPEIDFP